MKKTVEQKVKVPNIRTMDSLMSKYYDNIVDAVNDAIRSGELGRMLKAEILSKEILDVMLLRYTYWQMNENDLIADVEVSVDLTIMADDIEMEVPVVLCVGLWFDTADNFRCECEGVYHPEHKPWRDGVMLDRYLVPILGRDDIERAAESIWRTYYPGAMTDINLRTPLNLAKILGLTIVRLPLYKKNSTESILFFADGEVTVEDAPPKKRGDKAKTHIVVVPANTIVLNSNVTSHDEWFLCIYHECVHFLWHRMFYRLQDKHDSDDSLFEWIEMKFSPKADPPNPLKWMEFQADRCAYALMLPESIACEKIDKVYSLFTDDAKVDG